EQAQASDCSRRHVAAACDQRREFRARARARARGRRRGRVRGRGAEAPYFAAFEYSCAPTLPPPFWAWMSTLYARGTGMTGHIGFGSLPTTGVLSSVVSSPESML